MVRLVFKWLGLGIKCPDSLHETSARKTYARSRLGLPLYHMKIYHFARR